MAVRRKCDVVSGLPVIFDAGKLKPVSYPDLKAAKAAAGVESIIFYDEYARQAGELETPVRPRPPSEVYFGVNGERHAFVFTREVTGKITFEPGCALHVCDMEGLKHQMKSGVIEASGIRNLPGDGESQELMGSFVHLSVPPLIQNVAVYKPIGPGLPPPKDEMGVHFIHVVAPTKDTEILMRTGHYNPRKFLKTLLVGNLMAETADVVHEGQARPEISTEALVREVQVDTIKATIIAHPNAFGIKENNPQIKVDEGQVAEDTERYSRILARKYPGRTLHHVKNPEELDDTYRKYWIYM